MRIQCRHVLQLVAQRWKWVAFPREPTIRGGIERPVGGLSSEKRIVGRSTEKLQVRILKLRCSMLHLPRSPARRTREERRCAFSGAWGARSAKSPRLVANNGEIHHEPPGTIRLKRSASVVGDKCLRAINPPVLAVCDEIDERIRRAAIRICDMERVTHWVPGPAAVVCSCNRQRAHRVGHGRQEAVLLQPKTVRRVGEVHVGKSVRRP